MAPQQPKQPHFPDNRSGLNWRRNVKKSPKIAFCSGRVSNSCHIAKQPLIFHMIQSKVFKAQDGSSSSQSSTPTTKAAWIDQNRQKEPQKPRSALTGFSDHKLAPWPGSRWVFNITQVTPRPQNWWRLPRKYLKESTKMLSSLSDGEAADSC